MKLITGIFAIVFFTGINSVENNNIEPFKCSKKIVRWIGQINDVFPNENLDKIGGEKIKLVVYNLYSDKFFVPIFKETFENISKRNIKLINISGSYAACTSSIPGDYGELSSPIRDYLKERVNRRNQVNFSFETVKKMVIRLREQRREVKRINKILNVSNPNMNWQDLKSLKSAINSKYKYLLPSEIDNLKKLILKSESKIAEKQILKNSQNIINNLSST